MTIVRFLSPCGISCGAPFPQQIRVDAGDVEEEEKQGPPRLIVLFAMTCKAGAQLISLIHALYMMIIIVNSL